MTRARAAVAVTAAAVFLTAAVVTALVALDIYKIEHSQDGRP